MYDVRDGTLDALFTTMVIAIMLKLNVRMMCGADERRDLLCLISCDICCENTLAMMHAPKQMLLPSSPRPNDDLPLPDRIKSAQ